MGRYWPIRRTVVAVTLVMSGVFAFVWAGAPAGVTAPCNNGRGADLSLIQTAATDQSSNTVFTLTVTNNGPSCSPGAQIHVDLTGDYLSFSSINPKSWNGPTGPLPGPVSVVLTLTATIGVGSGGNTATVAVTTTPSSTSHAIAGADVTDPDCTPSFYCDGAGSNNETWGTLGTSLSFGPGSPSSIPSVAITRPSSANIGGTLLSPSSPSAVNASPPCSPNCLSSRQWIVDSPPTDNNNLMTMVIVIAATSKPSSVIYQFDHVNNVWLTYGACKGSKVLPCVDSVSFDRSTGLATITVLTPHFSHWIK